VDPLPRQRAADLGLDIGLCGARVEELGQPEVEELGVAVPRDHDIVGLDVPVDDVRLMGSGQALGDLVADLHGALEVELALGDQAADRPAFDVLHGDEHRAVGLVDIVDRAMAGWETAAADGPRPGSGSCAGSETAQARIFRATGRWSLVSRAR
jgi:hypothetical protein